jgi:hypothetical protein
VFISEHFKLYIPVKKDSVNKIAAFFIAGYSIGKIKYEMHRRASLNNGWQEQTRYKYQPFDYAKIITYFDYAILGRRDTIFLNNALDNGSPTDCPDLPIAPPIWYSQQPVLVDDCGNPIAETPDANGFYTSRIGELNTILQQNPFALKPCYSLNIMPLETYGANVAAHSKFCTTSVH